MARAISVAFEIIGNVSTPRASSTYAGWRIPQSTQLTPRTGSGSLATDPEGIENDGCNGTSCINGFNSTPLTIPVIANYTLVGTGNTATYGASGGIGMMLRRLTRKAA